VGSSIGCASSDGTALIRSNISIDGHFGHRGKSAPPWITPVPMSRPVTTPVVKSYESARA
jgi:hypothetical protein